MPLKLFINNQIHRFAKLPVDFNALNELILTIIGSQQSSSWTFQHIHGDGSITMIQNDNDYSKLLEIESNDQYSTVKLHLVLTSQEDISVDDSDTRIETLEEQVTNMSIQEIQQGDLMNQIPAEPSRQERDETVDQLLSQNQREEMARANQKITLIDQNIRETYSQGFSQPKIEEIQVSSDIFQKEKRPNDNSADSNVFEMDDLLNDIAAIEDSRDGRVVHKNTMCKGCGMKPIVGVRYKCSVCRHFNFCEECEDTKSHAHDFLKIRRPVDDKEDSKKLNKRERKRHESINEDEVKAFKLKKKLGKMFHAYRKGNNKKVGKVCERTVSMFPELKEKLDVVFTNLEQEQDRSQRDDIIRDFEQYVNETYDPEGKVQLHGPHKHGERKHREKHNHKKDLNHEELNEQQVSILEKISLAGEMIRAYKQQNAQKFDECRLKIEQEVPTIKPMIDLALKAINEGEIPKKVDKALKAVMDVFKKSLPDMKTLMKQWKRRGGHHHSRHGHDNHHGPHSPCRHHRKRRFHPCDEEGSGHPRRCDRSEIAIEKKTH